jgi:hypothetical protein
MIKNNVFQLPSYTRNNFYAKNLPITKSEYLSTFILLDGSFTDMETVEKARLLKQDNSKSTK